VYATGDLQCHREEQGIRLPGWLKEAKSEPNVICLQEVKVDAASISDTQAMAIRNYGCRIALAPARKDKGLSAGTGVGTYRGIGSSELPIDHSVRYLGRLCASHISAKVRGDMLVVSCHLIDGGMCEGNWKLLSAMGNMVARCDCSWMVLGDFYLSVDERASTG
jgi:hypothetical protein